MSPLIDSFGRDITYLRLSVTDRCDLRCTYCMAENMTFLPRKDLLSLEELDTLCGAFIDRGVRKIRLTGGEPLVRKGLMGLIKNLSRHLDDGTLDEITLTTNGTQLARHAADLKACGVERINVSLDTLDPQKFATLTRRAALDQVLSGIDTALSAGLNIKINAVALKGVNDQEIGDLMVWAHGKNMALTVIEVMPMGEIEAGRLDQFYPLTALRDDLTTRFTLTDIAMTTGGPARYMRVAETGGVLGFISPLTNNFCAGCNRVRVTCTGQIYMCLGQSDSVDLRAALRSDNPSKALNTALSRAMVDKPEKHDFETSLNKGFAAVPRHMSVTGG